MFGMKFRAIRASLHVGRIVTSKIHVISPLGIYYGSASLMVKSTNEFQRNISINAERYFN